MKIYFKRFCRYKNTIDKIFGQALRLTDNDVDDVAVGLCFVDEKQIQDLNSRHRSINKVTDVLSFPFLQMDYKKDKLSDFEAERDPDGMLYLGDIYICKRVAKKQAKEYGHSFKREVCFLALHGLLHLLGYDHIEKDDEAVMQRTANQILQENGVKRGKNHD